MRRNRLIMLCFLAAAPAAAHAQVCRGGIEFSGAKLQGQALVEVENSSSVYGASGGFGGDKYYGLGTLGIRTYENMEGSTVLLAVGGGRSFRYSRTGNMRHCVEVRGEFGTGPDNLGPESADFSSSGVMFSFFTALPLMQQSSLRLTPFAGISAAYSSVVTQWSDESTYSVNDFYELGTVGLGLSGGNYALQPYVNFPIARNDNDPVFGMRFSLIIGKRQ